MQTTITLKKTVAHPYFSLVCVLAAFFVWDYLPRFGGAVVMVACAGGLSILVWAQPESFRGRGGSMRLAMCLVIAMWTGAAVVAALALAGELHH